MGQRTLINYRQRRKKIVLLSLKPPRIKYPQKDPKEWGSKYWFYLHENASLYPEQPTDEQRANELNHINYFITHLPCKETCETKASEFIANNPPDLSSRKTYFAWTIAFHNEINKETGDEERIDSPDDLLENEEGCPSCNIPKQESGSGAEVSHDSTAAFADSVRTYKEAVRKLVRETYRKEGKKPPDEIVFARCGDGTETSCIVVDGGKRYAFYHPRDLVKTIFHEIDHGNDSADGKPISDSLNGKADKYASEMIEKYFPFEKVMMDKKGNVSVAHDVIVRESVPIPTAAATTTATANPNAMVSDIYGQPSSVSTDPNDPRILNDFPHLKQTLMEIKKEELKGEIREFEHKGGVLSHFDRIYEAPAGWTGLKPEELNLIHTPTIMGQVIMTLTGAYLSPLSRTLITSLLGIFLMIVGIGIHSRIPTRDIQLIQALASQLTWSSTIPALNPKNARRIKHDLRRLSDDIKEKKFHAGSIIETPNQEETAFKPQVFNPSFDTNFAFGDNDYDNAKRGNRGRMIPQGMEVQDVANMGTGGMSVRSSGNVIKLPKFSSRSHNRFF